MSNDLTVVDGPGFELMMRGAEMLAHSTWLPDSLTMTKDAQDKPVRLPEAAIRSNCFLVVDLARRWNASPIAVAQCIALVHGKICVEGKLVHAMLEAQLGTRLRYTFDDKPGEALGVVVSGTLPGESEPRTVEGTVAQWRTSGKGSPWMVAANWKRQLRYRGAREWARAHAPAVLLGIYTPDEVIEGDARDITPGAAALPPPDIPDAPAAAQPAAPEPPPIPDAAVESQLDAAERDDAAFLAGLDGVLGRCSTDGQIDKVALDNKAEVEERGLEQDAEDLVAKHRVRALASDPKALEAEYKRIITAMRGCEQIKPPDAAFAALKGVVEHEKPLIGAMPERWQNELRAEKDRVLAKIKATQA
jgi:RecT family protein